MRTLILRYCCLLVVMHGYIITAWAQDGNPFITNYLLEESILDNKNWAIEQDDEEVMLFANRKGILTYDGIQWKVITTPDVPYSILHSDKEGVIFVGCKQNFGYLVKSNKGEYHYKSISEKFAAFGDITRIEASDAFLYFYSDEVLFKTSINNLDSVTYWKHKAGEPFTGIINHHGKVFVNVTKLGIHKLTVKNILPIKDGYIFADSRILFSIPFDKKRTLVGASNNQLYLFNGVTFVEFETEMNNYIAESVLADGIDLGKTTFAISTLTGGSVILNKKTGKPVQIINYQTGLPDDEIYAIGKDKNDGLWLSHEFGFSRVDNTLPIRNYSNYPGLEGNLISLVDFDSTIYVSTSEGVFYLSEVQDCEEIEVLVKIKVASTVTAKRPSESNIEFGTESATGTGEGASETGTDENLPKKTKGIFKKLFRKKKKKNKSDDFVPLSEEASSAPEVPEIPKEEVPASVNPKVPRVKKKKINYEAQKIYALQSIRHIFKKIEGLNEKCKQLLPFNDRILVATNTGLFEIYNNIATSIVSNRYINFISTSRNPHRMFIGTATGVFSIFFDDGKWIIENNFPEFQENVYSIIEDDKHHLWLGCENTAFDVFLDKKGLPITMMSYYFENDYSELILVRNVFGKPFFFLSSGVYSYDSKEDTIFFNEKVNRHFMTNSRFIFSQESITWVFSGKKWLSLNRVAELIALEEIYLELFDNIQNIFVDQQKNMWVIDGNNNLFKVLSNEQRQRDREFNVYIRQIANDAGSLFSLSKLVLDYENSSLEFRIAAPYYVKKGSTEYQYVVEGLMKNWSKWTNNATIELPYIPAGSYVLKVRARNILGEISQETTFEFRITPPFWKSWWFILICSLLGIGLFYLVLKFRERNLKRTQKVLEEKVRIRTAQLEQEKEKSDELLLNILPEVTAEELKATGKATPQRYATASVMFTDFEGFTNIAEDITAEELVDELDRCFIKFDEIIEKYHLEKIKTIGDAYMCAGGIPVADNSHAIRITLAAIEITNFMEQLQQEKKAEDKPYWKLRLGIHSGTLVAGVVGKKKFAYDIWGDTVNTAARLESSGMPGKINISGATYERIKIYFDCKFRGAIEAKNKGKIDMYFVNSLKSKYSLNGNNGTPNELLEDVLKQKM